MSYQTTPAETVSVETLIQELIEGGAVAISLEKNLLSVTGSPHLHFRAHMPPVTGHEIAGQYRTVTVGGKNYDFVVEPVLDGPEFFEKLPIYADEDIEGLDSVPVAWGIRNLKVHLEGRLEEKLCNRYQFGDELHGYRVIEDLVEPIPSGWEVTVGAENEDTGREVWVLNTVDYDAYQVAVFPPNSGEPLISLEYNDVETAFDIFEELLDAQAPVSTSTDGRTMVPLTKEVREQLREKQKSLGTVLSQRLSNGGDTNNHATVNDTIRWVCSIFDAQRNNNRCEQLNGRIRGYLTASFENASDTEFSVEKWESLQGEPVIYALATAIHQWQIIEDEETGEQKLDDLADPGDIAFAVFDNGYLFKGGQNPQLLYDPAKVSHIRKIVDERDETRERINETVFFPDAGGNCALN